MLYSSNDESRLKRAELEILSAKESVEINDETGSLLACRSSAVDCFTHQIRLQATDSGESRSSLHPFGGNGHGSTRTKEDIELGPAVTGGIDLQCASLIFLKDP